MVYPRFLSSSSRKRGLLSLRRGKPERGAALVEAAIVIPLWIIIFYGAVELFFMITTYTALSQLVREGLYGGAIGMSNNPLQPLPIQVGTTCYGPDCPPQAITYQDCIANNNASPNCGAIMIQARIRLAATSLNLRLKGGAEAMTITISRVTVGPGNNQITVSIAAPYNSLFPLIMNPTLDVSATGPYGVVAYSP